LGFFCGLPCGVQGRFPNEAIGEQLRRLDRSLAAFVGQQVPDPSAARTRKEPQFAVARRATQVIQHRRWFDTPQPFGIGHRTSLACLAIGQSANGFGGTTWSATYASERAAVADIRGTRKFDHLDPLMVWGYPTAEYFHRSGGAAEAAVAARNAAASNAVDGPAAVGVPKFVAESRREEVHHLERLQQARMLRCTFGNPFHLVTLDRAWLSDNAAIPKLARTIYDNRAFDRLPLLADALMAAGCTNEDILSHCRSGEEHVRGCWVVDLVLGKQ
jgi:hypothetical protein